MQPVFWERYAFALIVTLGALGALYALGAYVTGRRGNARFMRGRALLVEETVALAPGAYAAIVRVEGRRLLIGIGSAGVTVLAPLGARDETQS